MTYAQGFEAGERQAFDDRRAGRLLRIPPQNPQGEYLRGYWDAYTPRDPAWALRQPGAAQWWQEREQ